MKRQIIHCPCCGAPCTSPADGEKVVLHVRLREHEATLVGYRYLL